MALTRVSSGRSGYVSTFKEDIGNTFTFTVAMGTTETDVSALFTTEDLTGTTRRKYHVVFDFTNIEGDANLPNVIIRLKTKVDGTNYRTTDQWTWTNGTDTTAVPMSTIPSPYDIQVTLEMSTALDSNQTIPYYVIREDME